MSAVALPQQTPTTGPASRMRRWWWVFSAVWLVFLVTPIYDGIRQGTPRSLAGAGILLAFGVAYFVAMTGWRRLFQDLNEPPTGSLVPLPAIAILLALSLAAILILAERGLATFPYLAVVSVLVFGRPAIWAVIAVAAVGELLERALSGGWTDPLGIAQGSLISGFAVWSFALMIMRNTAQLRATAAEARLAVVSERERFARDLHDILGHSLTVIAVKAELAGRLLEAGAPAARVRTEVTDLEMLARDALADVRRTASGYRDITLSGELARARTALSAAGIQADLPTSAEQVDSRFRELFAWAIREGVTNVVRHSHATTCAITLASDRVVIADDGSGPSEATGGTGLHGLRERAVAVGASVTAGPGPSGGFVLRVDTQETP